jgi:hypothetical protein
MTIGLAPIAHAAGPANDAFASAAVLALPSSGTTSTVGATDESAGGEQIDLKSCVPWGTNVHTFLGATVWYVFTPTVNVSVTFDTYSSTYQTVLMSYRWKQTPGVPPLQDLKKINCNVNGGPNSGAPRSRVGLALNANQTYYFQVGGIKADANATPATGTLAFHFNVRKFRPGIVKGNFWSLNGGFDGQPERTFAFGSSSDKKLVQTSYGDGMYKPVVHRGNVFYINSWFDGTAAEQAIHFGSATDKPIFGDWNGDGFATPGVVRGNHWYLLNDDGTVTDFSFGSATDIPVVGDWDGDRDTAVGVYRKGHWYLTVAFGGPVVDDFIMGTASDIPVTGDWDSDGNDTPGFVRGNVWYLNDKFDSTPNRPPFAMGTAPFVPITGDWGYAVP